MKKQWLYTLLFFVSVNLNAQEFKTPVDYLNYIGKEQENISRSMWKYTSAVAHSKSARRIDNTRKLLVKSIQTASKKIAALKDGYKGDTEYRNQILEYLSISEKNINEEYDKIIDMQEVAEQSYDAMEAYIMTRDLVNKKIDTENEKAELAQKNFCSKYNITLSENTSELGKKIKISNEVFAYHTELYLIFFKANVTDLYLSNAIEKNDIGGIQQNAATLIQYADEGLEKLKSIKPFGTDNSMVLITKKALEFYKKQGQQFVPKIVEFMMFNEKFETAKKTLESKSDKDRTKEEIDNYNNMVKQVNKEIDNYNKINNTNFQEKNNIINQWNTTGDNFISSHVPIG
ncbi:LIC11966 family surface protein [Flavobacterium sp. TBRC 19031]|uniref:LIC11966 family surface protein n=1 Tax=Flavobacterium mekongense TaxID=3379707 RepID=UPI00399AD1E9